jgi:tRNA A37 methylthiotransferase MiaB
MPLTIGLVQLNSGARQFLPYVAGLLQAYVQTYAPDPQAYVFLPPLSEFESLETSISALLKADIVGFSTYVWNIERSLAIARQLKQLKPEVLIVFGGPQVPNQAESFLRQQPQIDLCVHGEGEATFLAILEQAPKRDWSEIPGLSYLDSHSTFYTRPQAPRRKALSELPSPYLMGVFADLMAQAPAEHEWAILWETARGCPFSCTFCDWGSATQSKVNGFDLPRLIAELDWFGQSKIGYIFCCDANFGILKRDLEVAEYAAQVRHKTGHPRALVVQNSKNVTDRAFAVHRILAQAGLDTDVTLSMQSLNPEVLKKVKRENISLDYFRELRVKLMGENIKAYTDMILGLPGETYQSFIDGICTLIAHGQYHDIHIFTAGILPNAEMADPAYRAKHGIESVKSRCVYVHSPVQSSLDESILEYQELVIATASLPKPDWVKAMAFGWLVHFYFFNPGCLRMAALILHQSQGLSYLSLFESLMQPSQSEPLLQEIWDFFCTKAVAIQNGDVEYCQGPEPYYLGQWWWPQEFVIRRLVYQGLLSRFYAEVQSNLRRLLKSKAADTPPLLLEDCLNYSQTFLTLLHQQEARELNLHYNLWEVYQGLLRGENLALRSERTQFIKPWQGAPYTLQRLPEYL